MYLDLFYSPRKIPEIVHSYFYQILCFIKNPTKFGSFNLDISSSRYEFLKLVFKSVKINKKFKATLRLTDGAHGQRDPHVSEPE